MTEALFRTGKNTVTAITRFDSQSKLPTGVHSKKVDYNKPETLNEALRGQDALVITLSGRAPKLTDMQLINAADEAGVERILPNEWGPQHRKRGDGQRRVCFPAKRQAIPLCLSCIGQLLTADCLVCRSHS